MAPATITRSARFAIAVILILGLPAAGCGPTVGEKSLIDGSSRVMSATVQAPLGEMTPPSAAWNTEEYAHLPENEFLGVELHPLSTFAIDVDTASYANVRRFLLDGRMPPADAVRIEEMINYFDYKYPEPVGDQPFSITPEIGPCPWRPDHRLARIGIKGWEVPETERGDANLVFLLDVSGSMEAPDKLPLLKRAMSLLLRRLSDRDRVALAVYAGASGLVLPSTPVTDRNRPRIQNALEALGAGGSTHGSEGIRLAYDVAQENRISGGINRVILATDGDFNVGITSEGELTRLIEEKAKTGVYLTVLGFGTGNLNDAAMESLADHGNGMYAYIDSITEARKVMVDQMGGTLITVARDVKVQVELNPRQVRAYRLIGYENREMRPEEFEDDRKDAGELGSGQTVTALYELIPADGADGPASPSLKYQDRRPTTPAADSGECFTVRVRYKDPDRDEAGELRLAVRDVGVPLEGTSEDFRFASSVAAFGMLLRDSAHRGNADYDLVLRLAREGRGEDPFGYRSEFINLVRNAQAYTGR